MWRFLIFAFVLTKVWKDSLLTHSRGKRVSIKRRNAEEWDPFILNVHTRALHYRNVYPAKHCMSSSCLQSHWCLNIYNLQSKIVSVSVQGRRNLDNMRVQWQRRCLSASNAQVYDRVSCLYFHWLLSRAVTEIYSSHMVAVNRGHREQEIVCEIKLAYVSMEGRIFLVPYSTLFIIKSAPGIFFLSVSMVTLLHKQ